MNIRTKILIFILSTSILIFALAIGTVSYKHRQYTIETSKKTADLYAAQSAYIAKSIMESDLHTVKSLKSTMETYSSIPEANRKNIFDHVLKNLLINNPQFLSTSMSWELSVIDNNWKYPYGRLRTETFLKNGNVIFDIDSVEIDGNDVTKIYYKMKIGELKEVLANPYFYTYSEKDTGTSFLETSIAEPIIVNGKFVGIVGIDVSLQRFQSIVEQIKPFENSHVFIVANNGAIVAHPNSEYKGEILTKVFPEYSKNNYILSKIRNGKEFSFILSIPNKSAEYISFFPIEIGNTGTPWSIGFVVPMEDVTREALQNFKFSILITLAGMFFLTIVILFMVRLITKPIIETTSILKELEKGNIDKNQKLKFRRKDEMGKMAQSVNGLIEALNNTAIFAKKIGKGELDAEYKLMGENDTLGNALIEMKKNLINAKEQEIIRQKESEKLSWVQNGVTEINEILRLENENLETLTYEIVKYLINYLKANQGGFYVLQENNSEQIIKLYASYAFDRKKQLEATIEIGEGIVGKCVKEKNIIHLTNLPQGYLFVTSGLGEKSPENLIITPLIFEDNVYGVIEIASFNKFEDYQLDYIKRVSERIASSISNLKKTIRTAELLKESQDHKQILENKEKEIEDRMKALTYAQKEVELSELETAGLLDAISKKASIVQYDLNGNIINIDDNKLEAMGVSKEDLVGRNQAEFAKEAKESPEWYKKFWEDLKGGIVRKRIFEYEKNDIKIVYDETYIPILNQKGKPYKVINFSIDITEISQLKKEIKELKQKNHEYKS